MGARFQELFHSPPGVLFTFPSRYWYAIGQTGMLRLTQRSGLIHAGFHEARATWDNTIGRRLTSRYGAGTLYGQAFKPVPLASRFMTPARPVGTGTRDPTTPETQPPTGITRNRFGLIRFRSPLLTEYPFLQVLRCFTSLRTPRTQGAVPAHDGRRVPPFGDPRIKAMLEAPLGLSHPQTSFIGTVCQGIHHTPSQAAQQQNKSLLPHPRVS